MRTASDYVNEFYALNSIGFLSELLWLFLFTFFSFWVLVDMLVFSGRDDSGLSWVFKALCLGGGFDLYTSFFSSTPPI